MCHGHPHEYTCGHTALTWHYCPSAHIDLRTGYQSPCANNTYAAAQPSGQKCPLRGCDFRNAAGNLWTCCQCDRRNNTGWCTGPAREPRWERNPGTCEWEWIDTCDHGCCKACTKDGGFLPAWPPPSPSSPPP